MSRVYKPMSRDEAIALDNHILWKALVGEMVKVIDADTEKLVDKEDQALREKIKAMRMIVRMPQIIAEREE